MVSDAASRNDKPSQKADLSGLDESASDGANARELQSRLKDQDIIVPDDISKEDRVVEMARTRQSAAILIENAGTPSTDEPQHKKMVAPPSFAKLHKEESMAAFSQATA